MNENEEQEFTGETGKSSGSPTPDDTDFEPSVEMMVHDFDDESTLNEEGEDDIETNADELTDLAKEGEMPLEELLALYYGGSAPDENEVPVPVNDEDTGDEAPRRSLRSTAALLNPHASDSDSSDKNERNVSVFHEEDRKEPRIGDEYQVTVIPDVSAGDGTESDQNEGEQVWVPWKLPKGAVENYLKEVALSSNKAEPNSVTFIQDNEDALFLLRQADNDPQEALKRYKSRPSPLGNDLQVWSEEECKQFEQGLTIYGKDFYMIHMKQVRTKSIRDIVKFYYVWKKSERYDHFTAKTRLGKKKEILHSGVTDYMDKLLDETDNACTSSMLNHASGSYLKYCTAAHSAVLMEHLRQLDNSNSTENEYEQDQTLLGGGDCRQTGTSTAASNAQLKKLPVPININNNNNNASLQELDVTGDVIGDVPVVENSPGAS